MNRNKIFHDLGFSIRKVNEDEIEIKNSTFDGYLRGFFRALIISNFIFRLSKWEISLIWSI